MFDGATSPRSGPLRLAIISSSDEMGGIAGYTRALEAQLRPHADVTIFDLDQYLLRSRHKRVQRLADSHIRSIADRLGDFDSVNIQLEYESFGRTPRQILRRFKRLVAAAPAVSVTFHTVLCQEPMDWSAFSRSLVSGRIFELLQNIGSFRRNRSLGARIYGFLRARQAVQPVTAIVHTKRDARLLQDVFRIDNVEHHPLSFISASQAERIREAATLEQPRLLRSLPSSATLLGSFGFLSSYKGLETAVRALHCLPEDHHLLIFGGVHPRSIKREQPLDPYIQTLLEEAGIGPTTLDGINDRRPRRSPKLNASSKDFLSRHASDLRHRVHFLGVHDDDGFMRAMALCDMVVLPYLEVGQSSSGPIAMALEMGCRVLASRTLGFLQFACYHPDQIEFFDIGNYAELAELVLAGPPAAAGTRRLRYNTVTNTALYLAANLAQSSHGYKRHAKVPRQDHAIEGVT